MALRATYFYRSIDLDIHPKLLILVGETMKIYSKANNKEKTKLKTKRKNKKYTLRK